MSGFCKRCRSHFCPHVAAWLYKRGEAARYFREQRRPEEPPEHREQEVESGTLWAGKVK